jgi:TetR/AcrR family transcriptional regulator, regulator of cefoperazone and chloramphenicol sensitivity
MNADSNRFRPGTHQRGEDTQRRILDTAIDVFAVEGYEGASTRSLAEQAGVNLPAIQYYFGSKEGLYRAAIEHIIREMDESLAPVADRVEAALTGDLAPPQLLALIGDVLDGFALVIVGTGKSRSRKLFIARAEIECGAAVDAIHETVKRRVIDVMAALIGRLLGRPADDEDIVIRTVAILGQVSVFCHKGAQELLG